MKAARFIVIPVIIFTLLITVSLGGRLFFVSLARKELRKIFPASAVTIKECNFLALNRLSLSGIEIKNAPFFDINIKEAGAGYNLFALLKFSLSGIYLKDAAILVSSSKPILPGLLKNANQGSSPSIPLRIKVLRLENVKLKVESPDLNISGVVSLEADLLSRSLNSCRLEVDSLSAQGFWFKKLFLNAKSGVEGYFSIEQASYNKGKIRDIKSRVWLRKEGVFLDSLSFGIFDGQANGDLTFRTVGSGEYSAHLRFAGLDLEAFVRDFELEKKFLLGGKASGDIALEGKGVNFRILSGKFSALDSGGRLDVTDAKFLENLAQRSGKSLNILIEGFKNYHYNTASMRFALDNSDLTMGVYFEGEEGRRDLTVVVHDFKLGGGNL